MNANGFIYTWDKNGDLVAVNAAHIVSLTYDGDALTLNIGADELMTFDGEAALELNGVEFGSAAGSAISTGIGGTAAADSRDAARVTDSKTKTAEAR